RPTIRADAPDGIAIVARGCRHADRHASLRMPAHRGGNAMTAVAEQSLSHNESETEDLRRLADELFAADRFAVYKRTDVLFGYLMALQWVGAVVAALVISPRTWIGTRSEVHVHVYAAIVLGGIISS